VTFWEVLTIGPFFVLAAAGGFTVLDPLADRIGTSWARNAAVALAFSGAFLATWFVGNLPIVQGSPAPYEAEPGGVGPYELH
jgi:hypothetical protein